MVETFIIEVAGEENARIDLPRRLYEILPGDDAEKREAASRIAAAAYGKPDALVHQALEVTLAAEVVAHMKSSTNSNVEEVITRALSAIERTTESSKVA